MNPFQAFQTLRRTRFARIAILAFFVFTLLGATSAGVQAAGSGSRIDGGTNNPPVITEGTSVSVTMSEESTPTAFSLTLNASDLDGDLLTWSIKTQAANGTAAASGTGNSKAIGYTPNANFSGSDSFVVQVSDGNGGTDTITVNVTVENTADAPTISEGESISRTMSEDGSPTAFSLTLNASDPDPGTTLTWSIFTQATNGTATASGTGTSKAIGYTPNANYSGSDSFVVRVSDGSLTDSITVNVTIQAVNDAPVITEGASVNVTMSEDGAPTAFSLTLNATDADHSGASLTWSISTAAPNGAAAASGTGSSKAISYTPNANYNGTDNFIVQVSDGSLADTITVNVTIQAVNDPPTANAQSVSTRQDQAKAITLSGSDIEGSALTFSIASSPANGAVSGTPPAVTYTPNPGFQGTDSFTFTANDGTANSAPATVTINVGPANSAPVADAQAVSTNEDTAKAITLTATDGDSDPLTYQVVTNPANGSLTGTAPNLTYTPNANFNGSDSFTFKANDGFADSLAATVSITVSAVNDAPVLGAIGSKGISELVNLGFTVSASDIDGDTLGYSLSGEPAGASIGPASGAFSWTPTEAQGPGSFTFDICANDGTVSDCETITVTVSEVNTAPVLDPIGSQSATTSELLTFTATATDGDIPANSLAYALAGAPAGASIDPTSGVFTWTPAAPGTYTFDVVVSDGSLADSETITVTVSEPVFYLYLPLMGQKQ
jgi:VCBS repeat-containing protein